MRGGRVEGYQEVLTTVLDVVAVFLVAAGVGAWLYPYVGWACLAAAGLVVTGAVRVAELVARRAARPSR
jgi:hypothetical protein